MQKSLSLFFLLFSLMGSGTLYAQEVRDTRKAELSVRATATVTDNLQMLTIRNLDLINPEVIDKKVNVSPILSSFAGMFRISGNPGARVRITFLQNEVLKEENDQVGEVNAQYLISGAEEDTQFQSALLDVGEGNFRLSENGLFFIWLGANLDLSKATPGVYLSEFIIEMEYI
jgi:hypothetical protein